MATILGTDYTGIAALVAAFTGLIAAIGVVVNNVLSQRIHKQVSTDGDPRELGVIAGDIAQHVGATVEAAAAHETPPDGTPKADG